MKVTVIRRCRRERVPRRFVERWVRALSKELRRRRFAITAGELILVFVDAREMRVLNRRYRKKNAATDVLSFAATDASALGELVLCPSVLRSQSLRTNLSYRHELGYMIVHGCLHLLGYDHEKSVKAEKQMFGLQDQIFTRLISLDF